MITEPSSPLDNGRHFMSLSDGFPVPKHKTGALQHILGMNFLFQDQIAKDDFFGLHKPEKEECVMTTRSFNAKINNEVVFCFDKPTGIVVQPHNIGLIPASEWSPRPVTLEQIRSSYFVRRNGTARGFDVKLYNALCITKDNSSAYKYIGVTWLDESHFKINEKIFANFIGSKLEHLTLFDKQGPLSKYGFQQIFKGPNPKFRNNLQCEDVDDVNVRIFFDPMHRFSRDKPFNRVEF